MHFTSILLPILGLASTIGATPLTSRAAPASSFQITNFKDGGIRYSNKAEISFNVVDPATGAKAKCYHTAPAQPPVIGAPLFTKCTPSGISFAIQTSGTREPDGFPTLDWYLTVAHKYIKNGVSISDSGTIWLGTIIQTKSLSGKQYNYLDVPEKFSVAYNRYTQKPLSS